MGALTTTPDHYVTESEYLQSSFEVDCDLVDGHLEERNVGEIEHVNWQQALTLWFGLPRGFTRLYAGPEARTRVAPGRYRIPDVAVFTTPPQGRIVTAPPLAIFEILSPEDRYSRLKARFRDYAAMGVPNLFAIESRSEFTTFHDDQFIPIRTSRSHLTGSDAFVDWTEIQSLLWPNPEA